ncbi:MAG: hypothetical protein IKG81_11545 [Bacteroidales bacterium]|nr:hypothetical protein [Bacteroidales bacterium]
MKKISILVAAFAMIAFTGCNDNNEQGALTPDENGMVTLNLAGESYGSNDKQGYYAADQYIEFQIGDQCYGNAALADLTLIDMSTMEEIPTTDPTATSRFARLSILSDNLTFPFTILYPANAFQEGAVEDFPEWNVPMATNVQWIPENATAGYRTTVLAGQTSAWPMAAQVTDFRGTYQLKHTVAILTPAFKFGTAYLLALSRAYPNDFAYAIGDDIALTVDSVVLTSSNSMLTGNAHVNFDNPAEPTLVMDGTVPANGDVLIVKPNSSNLFDYFTPASGNDIPTVNLGNVCVAPKHTGDQLQMTFYFTLDDGTNFYHFVYTGNDVTLTETPEAMSVLRSFRTTLSMNLYNANGATKTTLLSID